MQNIIHRQNTSFLIEQDELKKKQDRQREERLKKQQERIVRKQQELEGLIAEAARKKSSHEFQLKEEELAKEMENEIRSIKIEAIPGSPNIF